MQNEELKKILNEKFGSRGDFVYIMYTGFSPNVKRLFENYVSDGAFPSVESRGWSFGEILKRVNGDVPEAFRQLSKIEESEQYARGFRFLRFGKK